MKLLLTFLIYCVSNIDPPPGTIKVADIFVDKTEVLNISWMEFLYHKKAEIDSLQYSRLLPNNANKWYDLPNCRYEPIVYVSYEQVLEYCRWRSDIVSNKLGRKIEYRLPTEDEWKLIAEELIKSDKKSHEKDLQKLITKIKKERNSYFVQGIQSPKDRVYNLFDNVSEMTIVKGIAIGSNNYQLKDLNYNSTILLNYDSPNIYLGFRCIAEFED